MEMRFVLAFLLGFGLGGTAIAQDFNRLTQLEIFVLKYEAGKAAQVRSSLPLSDREKQLVETLREKARKLVGGPLQDAEENFVWVLAADETDKQRASDPEKPSAPPQPKVDPPKQWLDAMVDGRVQKIWGWKDASGQIWHIPGDKPK